MSTTHVTSINPNDRFGCHPATLTSRFQSRDAQFGDQKSETPVSEPDTASFPQPAIQKIFRRIDPQNIIGKQALINFLYQKHLNNCKVKTLANYCISIIPFLTLAQTYGRTRLDQLKPVDLEAFVEQQQDKGMKPATLRLRLMCIYSFLRYLVENENFPSNRFVRKIHIRIPEKLPKAMSPNDVHQLLAVVNDIRNRAMILMLLRTGMRIG
jgi:integrase